MNRSSGVVRTHEPEGHGRFPSKNVLVTTGSEAVENAVKIARAATKRSGALSHLAALTTRTTRSLTGKVHPYSAGMGIDAEAMSTALYPCPLQHQRRRRDRQH